MCSFILPFLLGAATGVLSAWGIGGGTLLLLCMTLLLGVEQAQAQQINLLYFLPTAGVSLIFHRRSGALEPAVCRAAIPVGILCAFAAGVASLFIDLSVFRKPFGLFLFFAGVSTLLGKRDCADFSTK